MNELIRELEAQAENYAESKLEEGYAYDEIHFFYRQKFAELIVKECTDVIEICSHSNCYSGHEFSFAKESIKKHFGIEE